MARQKFMNTEIDNLTMQEALETIDALIQENKNAYVVTPNVDHIVQLETNKELQDVYANASLILTDGKPLLWIAKWYGTPIKEKISGSDLFPLLCDMAAKKGYKSNNSYDIIYFDHLPMCVYLDLVRNLWPDTRIILDEHNCESVITKRKEKETKKIGEKIFLKLETIKLEKFEAESIKHVTKTIVLSNADYASLKTLLNRDFIHEIIPIGVQDRGLKKNNNNTELNILFIGTLTWEPNNLGLIWFLKEVIPIIEKERLSYHLYIVGKNPSNDVRKICEKYKDRITITGYVESVDEYYDKCDLAIVPLFIGSGQRVKLIEAFSKGMPAISSSNIIVIT